MTGTPRSFAELEAGFERVLAAPREHGTRTAIGAAVVGDVVRRLPGARAVSGADRPSSTA